MSNVSDVGDGKSHILELQKKLYHDELMLKHHMQRGSKYVPFDIEPFPLERERLATKFTDEDRKLRKQWLEDQRLSIREPLTDTNFTNKNIYRRIYSMPYDAITKIATPFITWFEGTRGIEYKVIDPPSYPPGHPSYGKYVDYDPKRNDLGFSTRKSHRGSNFVTSAN